MSELIRLATAQDWAAIWPIWRAVVGTGETYTWDPDTDEATARGIWTGPPGAVYVVERPDPDGVPRVVDGRTRTGCSRRRAGSRTGRTRTGCLASSSGRTGRVVATARLAPNQPGLGAHVANAAFMVAPESAGAGIGRRLAEHVLEQARLRGYVAMQFNAVVETNAAAVALWRSLGFTIIGTVPGAFRHPTAGPVGLHVMHRAL